MSNKIAAGEVVERPASVVKELVENAIDAGSDRIVVEIEQGGRAVIRVSDNGCGMGHDDALLAVERYATSKIATESDLFGIKSLGFRGEALPSIAAVSRFTMISREEQSDIGTQIQVEGGRIKAVNPTGAPRGTQITVRQLFFNTPARRKFLKTISTEFGHIAETISCIALSRPTIQFRLSHNGKIIRDWHNVRNTSTRISDVLGEDLGTLLYPVSGTNDAVSLSGWVCDPMITRSNSGKIYTFVDGRFIRDRGLQHAVIEGYRGHLMKGRFPLTVLYLGIPEGDVDVNVHPTKHEVRFARHREIYDVVKTAVARAMVEKTQPTEKPQNSAYEHEPKEDFSVKEPMSRFSDMRPTEERISTPAPPPLTPKNQNAEATPDKLPDYRPDRIPSPKPSQASLFNGTFLRSATVIGQFRNTYILCEKNDALLLIDQHAAHERIIYEQLCSRMDQNGTIQIQKLLIPETIELTYRESAAIEPMIPELMRAGLEIEFFGENTFLVKAVPEILAGKQIGALITEIAEVADEIGYRKGIGAAIDECIIRMACHGAIRSNQSLTMNQMNMIMEQLQACENSNACPHGRPTMITWEVGLLERRFKRTP